MVPAGDKLPDNCIALTGGIATGKSTVADIMKKLGACIIDTDAIARNIVEPGMPALEAIITEFGNAMLKQDGTLNRERLREEIIRDGGKRERLNAITHPRICSTVLDEVNELRKKNPALPVIIDVPLLYEVGWHLFFNKVILVYIPLEMQIQRLMRRDNLDHEMAVLTVRSQMSLEEKRKRSHYTIDNSGPINETEADVLRVFNDVMKGLSS